MAVVANIVMKYSVNQTTPGTRNFIPTATRLV
jgi:hypothetical protein